MSNLLVTGAAGFIGANFVHFWRQRHHSDKIVVLDALTYAGNIENLENLTDTCIVHGNICDVDLAIGTLADHEIDVIVHFAAETHVDRSIIDPDCFISANIVGTHSLLKAARAVWLDTGSGREHRFHHVSTDEVYGSIGPSDAAFSETTPYAPNSPYSASKAASDHLVRAYHRTYQMNVTTSHCSNNYGPYQYPEKLIPLVIINCLHGHPLPIYGDGMNIRDWLHVDDHCLGIEHILKSGRVGETYNIGGGQELANVHVVDQICSAIDKAFDDDPTLRERFPHAPAARGISSSTLKTFVTDRKGHDKRYAIDDTKIRSELGYVPIYSFEKGLAATLEWYLRNEKWWAPLLAKARSTH